MTRPDMFSELEARQGDPDAEFAAEQPQQPSAEEENKVPASRVAELTQRVRELEQAQNEFIVAAMNRNGGTESSQREPQQERQETPQIDMSLLEHLDEDAAKGIVQLIQQQNQQFAQNFISQFQREYGPVLQGASKIVQRHEVESTVEGFAELEERVAERYEKLPPERQREYNNRLGIEALTLQEKVAQLQEENERLRSGASSMAGAAAMTPASRGLGVATGESSKEFDVWKLSDEEYEDWKRRRGL